MRELGELMLAVLAALTAENLFFSQGMGFDRVLQAARRGTMLGIYALLVTLFSLVSGLLLFWLSGMVPVLWLPLVSAGVTGGVYLLVCIVLVMGAPEWYRKISWCLAPAAIPLSFPFRFWYVFRNGTRGRQSGFHWEPVWHSGWLHGCSPR